METCYATSWKAGQKGIFQHLLTFVSEIDRKDYISDYPADGGGITELHYAERGLMMRNIRLKFSMVLILKDPFSGEFVEHK